MPPNGLYRIPRHFLYGGQQGNPVSNAYNSMNYANERDRLVAGSHDLDNATDTNGGQLGSGDKYHRKRKTGKHDNAKVQVQVTSSPPIEKISTNVKPKMKESKGSQKEEIPGEAPISSKKKRKRESESQTTTSNTTLDRSTNGSFVVGADMVQNLKSSMSEIGAQFAHSVETSPAAEKLFKKTKKSSERSGVAKTGTGGEGDELTNRTSSGTPAEVSRTKKQKKQRKGSLGLDGNTNGAVTRTQSPIRSSPYITKPNQTPIPLPENPRTRVSNTPPGMPGKFAQDSSKKAEVLVTKTPLPKSARKIQAVKQTSVPFSPLQSPVATTVRRELSKKERLTLILSTPTSSEDDQARTSAPAALLKLPKGPQKIKERSSLTPATLERFALSLNDEIKTKTCPRGVSVATSAGTSLPDSTESSISIEEAFARVGKPYVRSGAGVDSFVMPEANKRRAREKHDEAPMTIFNAKFFELQTAINFTDEITYLDAYLEWGMVNDSSDALPCLGKATGCTPKKEKILRLSKEENLNLLSFVDTSGGDRNTLVEAHQRSYEAESFLMMAMNARVPVPIGRLEGTWALFCPKYSESHFDRYGFGQRTLTISSVAGFEDKNSYTARLSIPPRSMPYTILAFSAPPHASFRTTIMKTSVEGYKMDVIFLGNGYLQLRVDLNLLLRGKSTEMVGGKKKFMEFLGVHEKALQWVVEKNELEQEGKKLFAKYGSIEED